MRVSAGLGRLLGLAKEAGLGVSEGCLPLSSAQGVCPQWGLGPSESTAERALCPRETCSGHSRARPDGSASYPSFLSGLWLKSQGVCSVRDGGSGGDRQHDY